MFLGKVTQDPVALFGSLPLSAAPKGGHTSMYSLTGRPGGGQQVRRSSDGLRGACTRDSGTGKGVVVFTS